MLQDKMWISQKSSQAQIMQSESCFGASSFSTKRAFSSTLTLLHFIEWVKRGGGDNGCFFRNPGCVVLYCVVLCCAVLSCAMLCYAVLCCAVSCCAVLCRAVLCCCAALIPNDGEIVGNRTEGFCGLEPDARQAL